MAIQRTGGDAELHLRRGFLLHYLDRKGDAVAAYRTATELDPSNQKAKYGLGRMLLENGQARAQRHGENAENHQPILPYAETVEAVCQSSIIEHRGHRTVIERF